MKRTEEKARANGIKLTEVNINTHIDADVTRMHVVYLIAEIDQEKDIIRNQHGKGTAVEAGEDRWEWSKRTLELRAELLSSVEDDLLKRHFYTEEEENVGTESGKLEEVDQI